MADSDEHQEARRAMQQMFDDIIRAGGDGDCAVHPLPQWTCSFCLSTVFRALLAAPSSRDEFLLQQAQPHVCSMLCPSTRKGDEPWAHHNLCEALTERLRGVDGGEPTITPEKSKPATPASSSAAVRAEGESDACADCGHPRQFHNAAGCGIEQCGCMEFAVVAPLERVREVAAAFREGYRAGYERGESGEAEDMEDEWDRSKASVGLSRSAVRAERQEEDNQSLRACKAGGDPNAPPSTPEDR